jgi:hypothetical protein
MLLQGLSTLTEKAGIVRNAIQGLKLGRIPFNDLSKTNFMGDLRVDGRIILKWTL